MAESQRPYPSIKLPPPLTSEEVIEALKNEIRFPRGISRSETNLRGFQMAGGYIPNNDSPSRSRSRTPGTSPLNNSSSTISSSNNTSSNPNIDANQFYRLVSGKTSDPSDTGYKESAWDRRVTKSGFRSNDNNGLDRDFAKLRVEDHHHPHPHPHYAVKSQKAAEEEEFAERRRQGCYLPSSLTFGMHAPSVEHTGPTSAPILTTKSANLLPDTSLSLLFNEITFIHENFRIHPMSPLTRQMFEGRGYKPTSEFIVEDDAELVQVIRTESGWWSWDLKGEYVCFVTGDDIRFARLLRDKGKRWAEGVEGAWRGS
ncbi:hypothetical protein TWF225_005918 [Orbilia oligospora]|uniref:Uncharacterized protein n=1 Tax=Orbilia oligospora TaxID=2813651 RepID=A0A7C8PNU6_ORBOL|nr:hypothetical protein TWF751_003368 [Orbilia oligospora]KAF3184629.1 hypothetical protein TWF225_005918 [Orbilia oligospora]KAF3236092.1 hypothetical protein TWF128_001488 [Orbilia oligospora]KAF3260913.1 hypothetical protein TWF217_004761 [Orbilia oligospora]KAF3278933.1 hypothetical protein TWF132_000816 [Orbilia oligospora]